MSIKVDKEKCRACGRCTEVCPGSLLYRDAEQKAYIRYPRDCWGCAACLKECPFGAIRYHLGADIGGRGTYLFTKQEKDQLHWFFIDETGQKRSITINRREANKY